MPFHSRQQFALLTLGSGLVGLRRCSANQCASSEGGYVRTIYTCMIVLFMIWKLLNKDMFNSIIDHCCKSFERNWDVASNNAYTSTCIFKTSMFAFGYTYYNVNLYFYSRKNITCLHHRLNHLILGPCQRRHSAD
jgi:hypothetical protein